MYPIEPGILADPRQRIDATDISNTVALREDTAFHAASSQPAAHKQANTTSLS